MNIALWVVAGLLAVAFLGAGLGKLTKTRAALAEQGMTYVEDFTDAQIKAIGATQVLGAVGLVVPAATGILPVLTPLAATGLALIMVGAIVVHVRRKETFVPAAVLGALAVVVAVGRFAVAPF